MSESDIDFAVSMYATSKDARIAQLEAALEQALIGLCGVPDSPQFGDLEGLRNYIRATLTPDQPPAPSPEWVIRWEREPTREDADEHGKVWAFVAGKVILEDWHMVFDLKWWMPKPRQQPPEPPREGK